ncbi:MAG: hypothetical protein FWC96_05085 [Oscillospiraceae bacterium]|nr:hypothetical protein [Oscillospiraceae bacterium]
MLFDSNIEPSCTYCRYGEDLGHGEVACRKRGIMASHGYCVHFTYEPTKRMPHIGPRFNSAGYTKEDFSL